MKVFRVNRNTSTEEMANVLANEFSSKYQYEFFGLDDERSIIVRKSEFVGAQISKKGNEITVHAMTPNLLFSFIDSLIGSFFLLAIFASSHKKLEKELSVFLANRYA